MLHGYLGKYSLFLAIRDMKNKTSRATHWSKCWGGCVGKKHFSAIAGHLSVCTHSGNQHGGYSKQLNKSTSIQPSHILGYIPKGFELIYHRRAWTTLLIAALFTPARTWSQPKCQARDEWKITKMLCSYIPGVKYKGIKETSVPTWWKEKKLTSPNSLLTSIDVPW